MPNKNGQGPQGKGCGKNQGTGPCNNPKGKSGQQSGQGTNQGCQNKQRGKGQGSCPKQKSSTGTAP